MLEVSATQPLSNSYKSCNIEKFIYLGSNFFENISLVDIFSNRCQHSL